MEKNVVGGNTKSKQKSVFILCCAFLVTVITSCGKQSVIRLKYTSGIRSVLEDSKGNTWFGSYSEGVCLLRNGKLQYFTTENGLSNNQVRNIYEDKNGIIWFECGKGLSIYDGVRVAVYEKYHYASVNEWKLNKNDIWFKGYESEGYNKNEKYPGVYQYDGQKLSYRLFPVAYRPQDGFKYYISTSSVEGKNGTTWFGAYGALVGYNGLDFLIFDNKRLGLTAETGLLHIRSILGDKNGNIWIGNNGMGVLRYDGKEVVDFTAQYKLKKKYTKGNSLEKVFSIGEDDAGNIWFGTVGSGVWRYNGVYVKNFTEKDGLKSKHIWTIYKSKQGEMWFGGASPSGVYRFNGSSFERKY
jgi:ligand-binding sensor domain-containing protein